MNLWSTRMSIGKLKQIIQWLAFLALILQCRCEKKKPKHPHLLLIVLRDLGWDDVSFHGNSDIPTPNIDRIANHGVIFHEYYSTPRCEDSIVALKTGKHPMKYRAPKYGETSAVSYDIWNYLDIMGYVIREVGKVDCEDTNVPFYPWEVVQQAEYVLRDHDQNYPLFLQINFPQLHADVPEQIPVEYLMKAANISSEARRVYAGMVMQLDRAIGHLVRLTYDTDILHEAVLFFTTLTGGTQNSNFYTWTSNYPLRGGNGTLWEGGSRSLGFVYSNRITQRARVSHGLMHITDVLPTFFRLAGGNPEHVVDNDGYDVWDVIDTETYSPRKELVLGIFGEKAALRMGDYKVLVGEKTVQWMPRSLAKTSDQEPGEEKPKPTTLWNAKMECQAANESYGCWPEVGPCLFNVRFDPCELNNLAYTMPQTLETLMYNLNKYNESASYRSRRDIYSDEQLQTIELLEKSKNSRK